jgi:hypothetical protein
MMGRTHWEDDGHPRRPDATQHAYNVFILVLTVLSLLIMVALFLPVDAATKQLLTVYDNLIDLSGRLFDFATNLIRARPKRSYFVERRG